MFLNIFFILLRMSFPALEFLYPYDVICPIMNKSKAALQMTPFFGGGGSCNPGLIVI